MFLWRRLMKQKKALAHVLEHFHNRYILVFFVVLVATIAPTLLETGRFLCRRLHIGQGNPPLFQQDAFSFVPRQSDFVSGSGRSAGLFVHFEGQFPTARMFARAIVLVPSQRQGRSRTYGGVIAQSSWVFSNFNLSKGNFALEHFAVTAVVRSYGRRWIVVFIVIQFLQFTGTQTTLGRKSE